MTDQDRAHARALLREQRHDVHEGSTLRRVGPIRRRRVRVRDTVDGRDVVVVLPEIRPQASRPRRRQAAPPTSAAWRMPSAGALWRRAGEVTAGVRGAVGPAVGSVTSSLGVSALPAPRVERRHLLAVALAVAAGIATAAVFLVQAGSREPMRQPAMVVWGTVEPQPTEAAAQDQAAVATGEPTTAAPTTQPTPDPTPEPTAQPTPVPPVFADGFSAQILACRSISGPRCQGQLDVVEGGQFVVLVQLEATKAGDVMTSHLVGPSGSTELQRFVVQRGGGGYMYTTQSAASFAAGEYRLVAQRNGTTVSERPLRIGG